MNILKTGDRFVVTAKNLPKYTYEFVGFDMDDAGVDAGGTGCHYLVLKNLTDNTLTKVERAWFSKLQTGSSIVRMEE